MDVQFTLDSWDYQTSSADGTTEYAFVNPGKHLTSILDYQFQFVAVDVVVLFRGISETRFGLFRFLSLPLFDSMITTSLLHISIRIRLLLLIEKVPLPIPITVLSVSLSSA